MHSVASTSRLKLKTKSVVFLQRQLIILLFIWMLRSLGPWICFLKAPFQGIIKIVSYDFRLGEPCLTGLKAEQVLPYYYPMLLKKHEEEETHNNKIFFLSNQRQKRWTKTRKLEEVFPSLFYFEKLALKDTPFRLNLHGKERRKNGWVGTLLSLYKVMREKTVLNHIAAPWGWDQWLDWQDAWPSAFQANGDRLASVAQVWYWMNQTVSSCSLAV